ncbi:copper amine oxidase N-terminal domain-containing protein [Paenibacillus campinasensis]|uniref:Copper amine oxidase N-terminal domain-containing protein n=2 Tax=Paenibacillus campinasensis TaxID=66347 RepID=A0ABW9T0B0_9BACL|nr:copper amine oxidase N-terminal domain-containing protein [Paenibacillus campinasensis]
MRNKRASVLKKQIVVAVCAISVLTVLIPTSGVNIIHAEHADTFQMNESVPKEGAHKLIFSSTKAVYILNDAEISAAQPMLNRGGYNYVPVSTMAKLQGFSLAYDATTKEARIKGGGEEYVFKPGSHIVKGSGATYSMELPAITHRGSMMVPVREWAKLTESRLAWENKQLTLSWGNQEHPEGIAPVADFATDKAEYRLGEPVKYENLSHAPGSKIVKETWEGNESAFFEPGEHEIMLEVVNSEGVKSSVRKVIKVLDESLYTKEEFDRLFTPIGQKFDLDASSALLMNTLPFTIVPQDGQTFIRSNSPEHLTEEGIAYQDTISGDVRINIHNQSRASKDLSVHLIATNPGSTPLSIRLGATGIGGPAKYVSTSGKAAITRYLEAFSKKEAPEIVTIPAGESAVLLPDMSGIPLKPGMVRTIYTDLHTDQEVKLSVVVADPSRDPLEALEELPVLPRDGKHVRGTFPGANREVVVDSGQLGLEPQRLVLGDSKQDAFLKGVDGVTGEEENNIGNTGVFYSMKLRIAPNTLVALNARGGHYAGALLVNGKVVQMTDGSILRNQSEAGVLYRTGSAEESVTFVFVPASGSNLPVNMLFMPLPNKS